ncbi:MULTISPECIES: hypothetical protein [unclassified Paenibacillus]|uniref:hypothetical protein n=1 Tax=unclassified Paenibacillus TaxID=185978 RepID=UPI0003F63DD4|nr:MULTISPECIES: hypothetical protein [unclassified Paenibacillus]KGP80373.1 hypothetical protein P364_0120210 [Paenibacillus sp. MAEPY2]KGP85353.1 hypothetical protein P363_0122225 [Paenibacillus sp. MAEPY1]
MSKGKSDKHIDSFDSELEDDFFDAAFDMAFDEAFHQAVSATPTVSNTEPMRQSWLQVQKEIARIGARKKRMRTVRLSVIVAASVTIGAVIFSLPSGTQAVSPFVQSVKEWGNGVKSIVIEDRTTQLGADPSTAKTPPPPERGINEAPKFYSGDIPEDEIVLPFYEESHLLEPIIVTKDIARSGFKGDFLLSKAIPERFTKIKYELMLDTLNPVNPEDYYESERMRVRYTGVGKNGEEEIIQFDYAYVLPGQVIEGPMLRETSIVKLADGSEAFMYLGPPYNTFQWMMGSVNMSLFGTVSEEEMTAIANDLQEQKFPGSTQK